MMPIRLTLPLAAVFVAGCAVGPSTRINEPAPRSVRPADSLVSAGASGFLDSLRMARDAARPDSAAAGLWRARTIALDTLNDRPWLDVLRDPVLVALVDTAIHNNRTLQSAVARVKEYRALQGVARADLFPQVSANGSMSGNQTVFGTFTSQNFNVVRLTGDLAWELDFWGRIRRQSQAAGFDLGAREEDERAAVVSLVSDVAGAYLELRELDQELAISEQTLESQRATLAVARQRFAEGVTSELDVRQFEAAVATPAARLAEFARRRSEKETQLAVLLGRSPGLIPRGAPLAGTIQAVAVPDSIPAELLLRRPDVRRAEHDWQAAAARVGLAIGNRLPKIMIVGQYGRQRQDLHDFFGISAEIYTLQAGVSVPLFTGGRLANQQKAARARVEQAQAAYEQAVLQALREAQDALVGLRLMRDELAAHETQARALDRASQLASRRYEAGVSSYLELLDAQRSAYSAELDLVGLEQQYLAATIRLYRVLGGGWSSVPKL